MSFNIVLYGLLTLLMVGFLVAPVLFTPVFQFFAPGGAPVIYNNTPILSLALSHAVVVIGSMIVTTVLATGLAILTTRRIGLHFLGQARGLASMGQTIPPVAVLALAVPLFGFGTWPILFALVLYGMFPIYENTIAGLKAIPESIIDVTKGIGMTETQRLWWVELPLAAPAILEGIRISSVISISTATLGSTIASKGLGEIIIAGLQQDNNAFIVQGSFVVAGFALLASQSIQALISFSQGRARSVAG